MLTELKRSQQFFADTIEEAEQLVEEAKASRVGELADIGIKKKQKKIKEDGEEQIITYYLVSFTYIIEKVENLVY